MCVISFRAKIDIFLSAAFILAVSTNCYMSIEKFNLFWQRIPSNKSALNCDQKKRKEKRIDPMISIFHLFCLILIRCFPSIGFNSIAKCLTTPKHFSLIRRTHENINFLRMIKLWNNWANELFDIEIWCFHCVSCFMFLHKSKWKLLMPRINGWLIKTTEMKITPSEREMSGVDDKSTYFNFYVFDEPKRCIRNGKQQEKTTWLKWKTFRWNSLIERIVFFYRQK